MKTNEEILKDTIASIEVRGANLHLDEEETQLILDFMNGEVGFEKYLIILGFHYAVGDRINHNTSCEHPVLRLQS